MNKFLVIILSLSAALASFAARTPRTLIFEKPKEVIISENISYDETRIKKSSLFTQKKRNITFGKIKKNRRLCKEKNTRLSARTVNKSDTDDGGWVQYFFDDFEGAFPDSWALYDTPTWAPVNYTASTGSKSAWCAGYDYTPAGNYFDNMNAWMVQGPFDLSAADDALLFFDFYIKSQPDVDELFVGLSTDGENFSGNVFSGDSEGWVSNSYIDAKNFAYSNSVYVGVNFYSNDSISNYDGAFIDNIELIGYHLYSNTAPDLAVQNVHIQDSFDGIFNFDIKNNSAQNQPPKSYYISVFVDGALDSKETNLYELASGDTATWDWQLAYFYLPGAHNVEILVEEDGGDVNTNDNSSTFSLVVTNAANIDLGLSNPVVVSAASGYFDFDVDNSGPGIAVDDSYLISVSVDGQFDSSARNSQPLFPGQFTTWQWATDYIYPSGQHNVDVTITSDLNDTNSDNNSIAFTMTVPSNLVATDLKLSSPKITDEKNAVFKFKVINKGPKNCEIDDYTIRVFVDGVEDSSAKNSVNLAKGVTAIWTWQLQYLYEPGLHKIKIDVRPTGGDLKPEDNTMLFQMVESGANLQTYNIPVFTSVVDHAFSAMLTATNGAPPYFWEIDSGALPNGIFLNAPGILAGKPKISGNFSFKVKCLDASDATAYADVAIVVLDAPPAAPMIVDSILPPAFKDSFFQFPINAVGGNPDYAWAFNGGAPTGVNISPTGSIYGTAATAGEYEIPVKVTDSLAASATAKLKLSVISAEQTINFKIKKLKITIPWKEHSAGNNYSDLIKFKAEFDAPDELAIGAHSQLSVFIGDFPICFIQPAKSKPAKKAIFKTKKTETRKGKAAIKKSKNKIILSLSIKNVNLADALADYGVEENAGPAIVFPVRISINDCDSGAREFSFSYSRSKSGKGKIKN